MTLFHASIFFLGFCCIIAAAAATDWRLGLLAFGFLLLLGSGVAAKGARR